MAMQEYASNAKGNTAVTLSGIALGAALLNGANCGNGGVLGGLLGNNCQHGIVSGLQAENAMLKAENYSDKGSLEAYKQSVADNKELRTEMYAFIKPLADEAAQNRVNIATLQAELKCCCEKQELREQILKSDIDKVALMANNGLTALQGTVACLQNTVAGITKTIVPASAICPAPMPQYNSWTAPTTSTTTSPAA